MPYPVSGVAYVFDVTLNDTTNPGLFKDTPTIAAGDFKLYRDGALVGNLTNLPTASGVDVTISLTSAEVSGARIMVVAQDVAGNEWGSGSWSFPVVTSANSFLTTIADALLNRDMSLGTDSGSPTVRTVRQALRFLRNKWSISGTTLTVTKENDTTASWTSTVGATPGADPITSSDPA